MINYLLKSSINSFALENAILEATKGGHSEIVSLLMACPSSTTSHKRVLLEAIHYNKPQIIAFLLTKKVLHPMVPTRCLSLIDIQQGLQMARSLGLYPIIQLLEAGLN